MNRKADGLTEEQVDGMVAAFNKIRELEKQICYLEETIGLVHNAIATNIARKPEEEMEIQAIYEPRLTLLAKEMQDKVT